MKVTEFTRRALHHRREVRKLEGLGFKQVELYRNWIQGPEVITDVVIGPDGRSIWWKKSDWEARK